MSAEKNQIRCSFSRAWSCTYGSAHPLLRRCPPPPCCTPRPQPLSWRPPPRCSPRPAPSTPAPARSSCFLPRPCSRAEWRGCCPRPPPSRRRGSPEAGVGALNSKDEMLVHCETQELIVCGYKRTKSNPGSPMPSDQLDRGRVLNASVNAVAVQVDHRQDPAMIDVLVRFAWWVHSSFTEHKFTNRQMDCLQSGRFIKSLLRTFEQKRANTCTDVEMNGADLNYAPIPCVCTDVVSVHSRLQQVP